MVEPSLYYLQHRSLLEWMIYRFLVSDLCGIAACLLFCASYLSDHVVSIALSVEIRDREHGWPARFFRSGWFWSVPALCTIIGVALVLSSVLGRLRTGGTEEHWSRYVAMTFWLSIALILCVTRIIDYCLTMVSARLRYLNFLLPADLEPASPAPAVALTTREKVGPRSE